MYILIGYAKPKKFKSKKAAEKSLNDLLSYAKIKKHFGTDWQREVADELLQANWEIVKL